jgi:DNA-binding SARP family transcriptional activator
VFVEDQGRVAVAIGSRVVDGSSIRRKVLGLLCFLVSRPRFSAARDEVLDALWPDFDPSDALNSLNQTVYFLRRVFEPTFQEDLSPGYLSHEGDVVWLDADLIQSRSQRCSDLIRSLPVDPTPGDVLEMSQTYRGPFALDFAYEEWATAYRSNLQSSYLQVVEKSIRSDIESGHFERGIVVARRALDVCPDADNIELSLLRLYKLSGSHAAAAEQYGHYSTWFRDSLGVEPPTLDSL